MLRPFCISCAHSWIKTQTMIRPTKLGKKRGDGSDEDSGEEDDDIAIVLTSRNPNVSYGRLWFVYLPFISFSQINVKVEV